MKNGMSDKELALLAAARREVAAKRGAGTGAPAAKGAASAAAAAAKRPAPRAEVRVENPRTVIGWDHPEANPPSLDAPTVVGWDNPAAQPRAKDAQGADAEKWARVAALMEAERQASAAKRKRWQNYAAMFVGALLVVTLFAAGKILAG